MGSTLRAVRLPSTSIQGMGHCPLVPSTVGWHLEEAVGSPGALVMMPSPDQGIKSPRARLRTRDNHLEVGPVHSLVR